MFARSETMFDSVESLSRDSWCEENEPRSKSLVLQVKNKEMKEMQTHAVPRIERV